MRELLFMSQESWDTFVVVGTSLDEDYFLGYKTYYVSDPIVDYYTLMTARISKFDLATKYVFIREL